MRWPLLADILQYLFDHLTVPRLSADGKRRWERRARRCARIIVFGAPGRYDAADFVPVASIACEGAETVHYDGQ